MNTIHTCLSYVCERTLTLLSVCSSIGTQVIIDHDYLGPLCLQFASPPTVADIKNELLVRTGLPVKDQFLYCNGKKVIMKKGHSMLSPQMLFCDFNPVNHLS